MGRIVSQKCQCRGYLPGSEDKWKRLVPVMQLRLVLVAHTARVSGPREKLLQKIIRVSICSIARSWIQVGYHLQKVARVTSLTSVLYLRKTSHATQVPPPYPRRGAFLFLIYLLYICHGSPHETYEGAYGEPTFAPCARGPIARQVRVWSCARVSPRMSKLWALPRASSC